MQSSYPHLFILSSAHYFCDLLHPSSRSLRFFLSFSGLSLRACHPEIDVARASAKFRKVTNDRATVDALVSGAVDGVDGAASSHSSSSKSGTTWRGPGSSRAPKKGCLLEQRLGMPGKAMDDAGAHVNVGQVGEAEQDPVKRLSHNAYR